MVWEKLPTFKELRKPPAALVQHISLSLFTKRFHAAMNVSIVILFHPITAHSMQIHQLHYFICLLVSAGSSAIPTTTMMGFFLLDHKISLSLLSVRGFLTGLYDHI